MGNENKDERQKVDTLKDIGMRIIAKCDDLPLAVKVMGASYASKRPGEAIGIMSLMILSGQYPKCLRSSTMQYTLATKISILI
jgi:hypothetical protein